MKEADRVAAQVVPPVALGPKPAYLNNVKLAAGASGPADPNAPPVQVSFLRKYVSFVTSSCTFIYVFICDWLHSHFLLLWVDTF
jgi:hypothetical protein